MEINILDHFLQPLWSEEQKQKRYIVLNGGAGSGKAVPLDTKIITPLGTTLMKDIKVGDEICNTYGGTSKVLNVWDNAPHKMYRLTFEDGRYIRCADNHLWTYYIEREGEKTADTRTLLKDYKNNPDKISFPLPDPVYGGLDIEYKYKLEDIQVAYALGRYLASGGNYDWKPHLMKEILKDYGLISSTGKIKFSVPKEMLYICPPYRLQFVYGFLNENGGFDPEYNYFYTVVVQSSIAKRLRQIIWSLGGICSMKHSMKHGGYLLKFNFKNEPLECILRGAMVGRPPLEYIKKRKNLNLRLTTIVEDGQEPCRCIEVDSEDHLYLINDYIATHNSAAICQKIAYMFLTQEDMAFAVVRSTMPALTRSVYLGDPSIYKTLKDWGVPVDTWLNKTEATMRNPQNNSVMYFIGLDDPEKIKSMNLNYIFIEEATEINADKWSQLNTRLRRKNPYQKNQMYIAYNPISYYNWVVQMFVVNPDPLIKDDSIVHFSNFTMNPYVSLENVRGWFARAAHDEAYYRTYIVGIPGQPLGLIYPNIAFTPRTTWPAELWDPSIKPYYGIDWGYIDPMVLVECRDYGGKTYVICRFYETKKNTKEFIEFIDRLGVSKSANIYYDSADAERGNLLMKAGYQGFKARKNINAGISYVKGFDIVVDSMGPYGEPAMDEVRGYVWQTDPDDSSKFIEKPIEVNNHFCDALRYAIVTEHVFGGEIGVGSLDMNALDEKLRKSGVMMNEM